MEYKRRYDETSFFLYDAKKSKQKNNVITLNLLLQLVLMFDILLVSGIVPTG
jgi:hypothetical protein